MLLSSGQFCLKPRLSPSAKSSELGLVANWAVEDRTLGATFGPGQNYLKDRDPDRSLMQSKVITVSSSNRDFGSGQNIDVACNWPRQE
jgi:hypothetical protein